MHRAVLPQLAAVGVALALTAGVACSSPRLTPIAGQEVQVTPADEPAVDPRVDELVRAFSGWIRGVPGFRVRVADTLDVVEDDGQKLQYAHVREALVRRPDRVWSHTRGDLVNRTVWKDGRNVTMLDPEHEVFARIDDPGTIEQMMDVLMERYGFSTPMADVLSDDPHGILMGDVTSARYLGEHLVGEEACHHLAFEHPDLDFQLWLSPGDVPELRKLIITHKHEPGAPQYTMVVLLFEPLQQIPEVRFQPRIPEGVEEIEIVPLDEGEERGR